MVAEKLTPLQLELLKVYSFQPSEDDLLAIKKFLANYFATKAMDRMDKIWEERGFSDKKMNEWLKELKRHKRFVGFNRKKI